MVASKKKPEVEHLPTTAPEEPPAPEPPLDAEIRPRRPDEPPQRQPSGSGEIITDTVLDEAADPAARSRSQPAPEDGDEGVQYDDAQPLSPADRRKMAVREAAAAEAAAREKLAAQAHDEKKHRMARGPTRRWGRHP